MKIEQLMKLDPAQVAAMRQMLEIDSVTYHAYLAEMDRLRDEGLINSAGILALPPDLLVNYDLAVMGLSELQSLRDRFATQICKSSIEFIGKSEMAAPRSELDLLALNCRALARGHNRLVREVTEREYENARRVVSNTGMPLNIRYEDVEVH